MSDKWIFSPSKSGKYLVAYEPSAEGLLVDLLSSSFTVFNLNGQPQVKHPADVLLMPLLGVAVLSESALMLLVARRAEIEDAIIAIEPEGEKRAISHRERALQPSIPTLPAWDESEFTWGLQATGVKDTNLSGKGIRIGILDTGVDLNHPDLGQRVHQTHTLSFVPNSAGVEDMAKHGTHCIGTVGGPRRPQAGPRYGVACDSELWVGKVLGDDGAGEDSWIIAGIHWAVRNHCKLISLSLGSPASMSSTFSKIYEAAAIRAIAHGCLIVAAAGNDSGRHVGRLCPVSSPANCPSILAVGALDSIEQGCFSIADFSNAGLNIDGGQIDLCAPGVFVYSAFPLPIMYMRHDGTSMATPHVCGIAALLLEENPALRPRELWSMLLRKATKLPMSHVDVGAGIVTI